VENSIKAVVRVQPPRWLLLPARFRAGILGFPETGFASPEDGGLALGILAPSLSKVDDVAENLSTVKIYIFRNTGIASP
jgi:hypothetical protein